MNALTITTTDGSRKSRELTLLPLAQADGMILVAAITDKEDEYHVRIYPAGHPRSQYGHEECTCVGNREFNKRCYHIREVAARKDLLVALKKKGDNAGIIHLADGTLVVRVIRCQQTRNGQTFGVATINTIVVDVRLCADGTWEQVAAIALLMACVAEIAAEQAAVAEAQRIARENAARAERAREIEERIAASRKESEKRSQAPLNGNRGFSLWR